MAKTIKKSVEKLTAYTPGEQPVGGGWVKLNTNENPYPPSPRVARVLNAFAAGKLRLYPDPVASRLRTAIARLNKCKPENVFVGNGSDEILSLCTKAFVEDNGSIGFFVPSYSLYPVLAAIRDVKAKPIQLGPDFEWAMPAGFKASLFFMANPNAPTSRLFDRNTVRRFCRSFPGVVLVDEAYADFASANCIALARSTKNVIVCRTLSKSYSLAGIRLGYAIGPANLIAAMFKLKDSYNTDALTQALALAAVEDDAYMRRNVRRIKSTRNRLTGLLKTRGFKVHPSETNFLWVRPSTMSAERMFKALRKRKVLVRYFKGSRTGEFLRITIGSNDEIDTLVKAIDRIQSE